MRGALYLRGKTWWYRATVAGGRQYRRSLSTSDRQVADRRALECEATVLSGIGLEGSTKLRRWMATWLEQLREQGRTPSTLRTYRRGAEAYVLPRLGATRIDSLTVRDVERMDAELLRRGGKGGCPLDPVTVRQVHDMLSACLAAAVHDRIVRENVASIARRPKAPRRPARFLERNEALRIFEAARSHEWGAFVAVAVLTGLRAGELCGLRWSDVDLDGGHLRVERQRRYDGPGVGFVDAPPKSEAGVRTVPLSPEAAEWLSALRQRQQDRAALTAAAAPLHVFAHPGRGARRGEWVPWTPTAAARGVVEVYEKAAVAGPKRPIHTLRHTTGTLLAAAREDPKVRAALLGHSRVTTTYDYTHLSLSVGKRAMDEVGRLTRPDEPKPKKPDPEEPPQTEPPTTPSTKTAHEEAEHDAQDD